MYVTKTVMQVQAIERAANGRKKQFTKGKKDSQPGFFRLIRPDSGFTGKDWAWRGTDSMQ